MIGQVEQNLGPIDILVNNAAVIHKDLLENMSENDWDHVIDTNLKSAFLVTQACLPQMRAKKWGALLTYHRLLPSLEVSQGLYMLPQKLACLDLPDPMLHYW